jgi:hypothetical protein
MLFHKVTPIYLQSFDAGSVNEQCKRYAAAHHAACRGTSCQNKSEE